MTNTFELSRPFAPKVTEDAAAVPRRQVEGIREMRALRRRPDRFQDVATSQDELDRLPGALNELYPPPEQLPADLRELIGAIAETTRRRRNR
jgi:hypothetical protein